MGYLRCLAIHYHIRTWLAAGGTEAAECLSQAGRIGDHMDDGAFDAVTRSLTASLTGSTTRRGMTRLLGGLALGGPLALVGLVGAEAKCKKKCGPCKRCKHGKCKPRPAGTVCAGGTCQRGACVASTPAVACSCPVGKSCLSNGRCAATCDPAAQNCPASCKCVLSSPSAEGAILCIQTRWSHAPKSQGPARAPRGA